MSCDETTYANVLNIQRMSNTSNRKGTPASKITQNHVILILVVLLILMFLILVVLTSLLCHNWNSTEEESFTKDNGLGELIKRPCTKGTIMGKLQDVDTEVLKNMLIELENRVNERTLELRRNVENLKEIINKRTAEIQQNVESLKIINCTCESGWRGFEGRCYFFSDFQLNWTQAERMCRDRGSHLVIINDGAEQKFLMKNNNGKFYWIGLTDLETEGTFKWIDGTGLSYTFWSNEEPNNHNDSEHCANLFYGGKWNDLACDQNIYAICEKRMM